MIFWCSVPEVVPLLQNVAPRYPLLPDRTAAAAVQFHPKAKIANWQAHRLSDFKVCDIATKRVRTRHPHHHMTFGGHDGGPLFQDDFVAVHK